MARQGELVELRMVRLSARQSRAWREVSDREGYWSLSEWIRVQLDRATGYEAPVEVIGDEKAIAVFSPSRAEDNRPFLVSLGDYETAERRIQLLLDVMERPWCTPGVLRQFLQALARAGETTAAAPVRKAPAKKDAKAATKIKAKVTARSKTKARGKPSAKPKARTGRK